MTNPQDELLNLILEAGLTPADNDLHQVLRAVRGGQLTTFTDTGVANAIVITPTTAHTALQKGLPFRIFPAATNTSTTVTIEVGTLATVRLKKRDGTDPAIGDIVAGQPYDVVDDGTNFRLLELVTSDLSSGSIVQNIKNAVTTRTSLFSGRAAGTYNLTVPAGITKIFVPGLWGAGGGGGYNSNGGAPSGGATGAYCARVFGVLVNPGDTITVVIGAGGLGGAASPARAGQPGGASSITINSTVPGVGTVVLTAGPGAGGLNGATAGTVANSPAGGAPSGGDTTSQSGTLGLFGAIQNGGTIFGGNGAGAPGPGGGTTVPGGQGAPSAGASPGGGGAASGNNAYGGGNGADGGADITY